VVGFVLFLIIVTVNPITKLICLKEIARYANSFNKVQLKGGQFHHLTDFTLAEGSPPSECHAIFIEQLSYSLNGPLRVRL
jgi:hypothetical protein